LRTSRCGAALILAVLLSLAATLMAHGVFVLARGELLAARSGARVLRVRHVAMRAVGESIEHSFSGLDSVDVGATTGSAGETEWWGRVRRLSPEVWLVEGEAWEREVRRRLALPVWRLDPRRRVDALAAALTTGGSSALSGSAQIEIRSGEEAAGALPPEGCRALDGSVQVLAPWKIDPDSGAVALGGLGWTTLLERTQQAVEGVGSPMPVAESGTCVASPWNWGDPGAPEEACGGHMATVAAESGVRVEGGRGQGLVVARGDLTLAGTSFHGVVLVEGVLRLEAGAVVTGLAVARGGAEIGPESRLLGSRCWAEAAFGAPALQAAAPIMQGGWIRPDG
jgi:hypothetical protein